jgi:hypothetical protein
MILRRSKRTPVPKIV